MMLAECIAAKSDHFRHYMTWRVMHDAAERRKYVNTLISIIAISLHIHTLTKLHARLACCLLIPHHWR